MIRFHSTGTELGGFQTGENPPNKVRREATSFSNVAFSSVPLGIFTLKGRTKNYCGDVCCFLFFPPRVFPSFIGQKSSRTIDCAAAGGHILQMSPRTHLQEASKLSHRPEIAATDPIGPLESDGQMARRSFCSFLTRRVGGQCDVRVCLPLASPAP